MQSSLRRLFPFLLVLALGLGASAPAQAGDFRLGFGLHYWKTVKDIKADGVSGGSRLDDHGVSQVFSVQYVPSAFFKWEVDAEYFNKGFGGSTKSAWAPQVYALFGRGIYAGVGVGATTSSGFKNSFSDPFYAARGGFEIGILPRIDLDLDANYRFNAWSELKNAKTDVLTLAAVVRLTL